MAGFQAEKALVREYFDKMEKCSPDEAVSVLKEYVSPDYFWEGVFPFMEQKGAEKVAEVFWKPLKESLTSMQRRQDVFIAGSAHDEAGKPLNDGKVWVMSMGQFMGLFDKEFLGVRITGKMHHLQYAEYSCVQNGKIIHTAMFVDLIGFMNEAGVYPIPPETGHYFVYPGPRDHNGLLFEDAPPEKADKTMKIILDMIDDLSSLNVGYETPPDLLRKTWHEDMIWYGPCGIGASFTIPRYQKQHQIPFRTTLGDKRANDLYSFFAEGDFACFFGSMNVTPHGGWLGMTGSGKDTFLRGDIDIYYCKDGKISENWCYIDLPFWLNEQGLNIFERTSSICNPKL